MEADIRSWNIIIMIWLTLETVVTQFEFLFCLACSFLSSISFLWGSFCNTFLIVQNFLFYVYSIFSCPFKDEILSWPLSRVMRRHDMTNHETKHKDNDTKAIRHGMHRTSSLFCNKQMERWQHCLDMFWLMWWPPGIANLHCINTIYWELSFYPTFVQVTSVYCYKYVIRNIKTGSDWITIFSFPY